jgi:hypothetical protein
VSSDVVRAPCVVVVLVVVLVMFLKLKEFDGILFHPEESVSLSIVRVGPYLVVLVCIPPFIDYPFRVY